MKQYTFQDYMLPIINIMADRKTRSNQDIRTRLIEQLKLSGKILEERSKNRHLKYADNINFALSYLYMAGLLDKPKHGQFTISNNGIEVYKKDLDKIDTNYLKEINEEFKIRIEGGRRTAEGETEELEPNLDALNPNELIERGESIIRDTVKTEIYSLIMASSPDFFEKIVVDLVMAMGYGFDEHSGHIVGKSHDGGIDGTILEDKLGLSKIHLQAKRFKEGNTVGRPEIQKFAGSIGGAKGIFITTSSFSKEAIEFAKGNQITPIALIDSDKLLDLMYEYNVGVFKERAIEIKTINTDYFTELN